MTNKGKGRCLGHVQEDVLKAINEHHGTWHAQGCG